MRVCRSYPVFTGVCVCVWWLLKHREFDSIDDFDDTLPTSCDPKDFFKASRWALQECVWCLSSNALPQGRAQGEPRPPVLRPDIHVMRQVPLRSARPAEPLTPRSLTRCARPSPRGPPGLRPRLPPQRALVRGGPGAGAGRRDHGLGRREQVLRLLVRTIGIRVNTWSVEVCWNVQWLVRALTRKAPSAEGGDMSRRSGTLGLSGPIRISVKGSSRRLASRKNTFKS